MFNNAKVVGYIAMGISATIASRLREDTSGSSFFYPCFD